MTPLRLLPAAILRFPLFVTCWLLLLVGGVCWLVLDLTEPEGEEWELIIDTSGRAWLPNCPCCNGLLQIVPPGNMQCPNCDWKPEARR